MRPVKGTVTIPWQKAVLGSTGICMLAGSSRPISFKLVEYVGNPMQIEPMEMMGWDLAKW